MFDDALTQALLDGQRTAVVEKGGAQASELLQSIHAHTGSAYRLGITGPPGAGKSTLINRLIASFRRQDKTVAVLAIDPSSPWQNPYCESFNSIFRITCSKTRP